MVDQGKSVFSSETAPNLCAPKHAELEGEARDVGCGVSSAGGDGILPSNVVYSCQN